MDANGVVGQVLRVTPYNAQVMLITDPNHAIPVQVNRNGLRTIALGTDGGVFISTDGGDSPVWPRNGRELFFLSLQDKEGMRAMMAVPVRSDPARPFGTPQPLFRFRDAELRFYSNPFPGYDVSGDGQRFFVTQAVASPPVPPATTVHVVQNWFEELKAKVPATR